MPFVPGQSHDVFLSYDHFESEWVKLFSAELLKEFQIRAGRPFTIWQDTGQLQMGAPWSDSIQKAIEECAAFLAIVSPSYLGSPWCKKERKAFFEFHGGLEGLTVSANPRSLTRFLKVVKTPDEQRAYESLESKIQALYFFDEASGKELLTHSTEFTAAIRETERAIRELLNLMCNQRQSVYVAPVPTELTLGREVGRNELADLGYNMRPQIELDESYADTLLDAEMKESTVAIFLMGSEYDSYIEKKQMPAAEKFKLPMFFWIDPDKSKQASGPQAKLISRIREHRDLPSNAQVLGGPTVWHMVHEQLLPILDSMRKKVPKAEGALAEKLYLLYDTTRPQESQEAIRISEMLSAKLTEVLAEKKPKIVRKGVDGEHEELMHTSKAVMLFRKAEDDPDEWLNSYKKDLVFSQNMFERDTDFQAKAALISKPQRLGQVGFPVIGYTEPFSPESLGPFLDRL
jgi:hypothetical protein